MSYIDINWCDISCTSYVNQSNYYDRNMTTHTLDVKWCDICCWSLLCTSTFINKLHELYSFNLSLYEFLKVYNLKIAHFLESTAVKSEKFDRRTNYTTQRLFNYFSHSNWVDLKSYFYTSNHRQK